MKYRRVFEYELDKLEPNCSTLFPVPVTKHCDQNHLGGKVWFGLQVTVHHPQKTGKELKYIPLTPIAAFLYSQHLPALG